ncbi:amino acid decarboxylase [Bacillus sp. CGMCC 1.16607]|uniref:amino acid decarboxylase n=1 Tax=Bacillus sp. CGMCC 1.16607 TaxID=3351842 RepID=UPI0036434D3A
MLNIQREGSKAIIDARDLIKQGIHPRGEIIEFIKSAEVGTIIEVHLPLPGQPLIAAVEQLGLNCVHNEIEPDHHRILILKI